MDQALEKHIKHTHEDVLEENESMFEVCVCVCVIEMHVNPHTGGVLLTRCVLHVRWVLMSCPLLPPAGLMTWRAW